MPILNMNYGANKGGANIGEPTNISATATEDSATITWTDGDDLNTIPPATFFKSVLVRKVGSAPTSPSDGTTVVTETVKNTYSSNGYTDTGLTDGTTYYYQVFSYSDTGGITYGTPVSVTPTSITNGYYDMITDSFYSDANLTTLITPTEGAYYKYIRYTTPVFYKYTNGQFIVQKKNGTTVTKNTTVSLGTSSRREMCTWNGRGIGVTTGWTNGKANLMKRTDTDTVTIGNEITSPSSYLCGGANTKQGTIFCGNAVTVRQFWNLSLDYDNNSITSSNDYASGNYNDSALQANMVAIDGTTAFLISNGTTYYAKGSVNSSTGVVSADCYAYSGTTPANNACGGMWSNGKILTQSHETQTVNIGTPSADGTSISWTPSASHGLSSANSLGSDRKGLVVVGSYNSTSLRYSFDNGDTWNSLTAQSNTGGQIFVDELGDIWYTSESSTSNLGWIRFGDFKTEEELD